MILHSVFNYISRMGLLESSWDDGSFVSKGDIYCRTISCANCPPKILHQVGDMVYVDMDLSINTALADKPEADLMGPFTSTYMNV